jgi:uncharacterized protein (TIGR00270 family)
MKIYTSIAGKVKVEDRGPRARIGDRVGDCEICGASKIATRSTMRGRSSIEACLKCMDRMGLDVSEPAPPRRQSNPPRPMGKQTSGGYGGSGRKGKDIMLRRTKELRNDFPSAVRNAREDKGWDQRELAKRMAERVNIIQHTEGGKRPTDSVISKFERILEINLMIDRDAEEETMVRKSPDRQMTMEDLYEQAKRELRGD